MPGTENVHVRGLDQWTQRALREESMEGNARQQAELARQRLDLALQHIVAHHVQMEVDTGSGDLLQGAQQGWLVLDAVEARDM